MSNPSVLRSQLIRVLILLIVSVRCTYPISSDLSQPWNYSHLRSLDSADAVLPSQDMLAFYSRANSEELQLRLDWLDHATLTDYDLILVIDSTPGGTKHLPFPAEAGLTWDTLLEIPASGAIQSVDSNFQRQKGLAVRVLRDSVFDTITISWNYDAINNSRPSLSNGNRPPGSMKFQVFLLRPDRSDLVDQSDVFEFYGSPPAPARVLFAFWNTYPAYTPALAMRRWDGAHSGPLGSRHGLYNLLRAASAGISEESDALPIPSGKGTPIVLLDLKFPASLSALDFIQELDLIHRLSESGLVILPEYIPDFNLPTDVYNTELEDQLILDQRKIADQFQLPPSPYTFTSTGWLPFHDQSQIIFQLLENNIDPRMDWNPVQIYRWHGKIIIPIISNQSMQATSNGPSLDIRRALIETALLAQHETLPTAHLLVLGGELPASTWGDPQTARATFRYLESRPWIQPIQNKDLRSMISGRDLPQVDMLSQPPLPTMPSKSEKVRIINGILAAPDNSLRQSAWQLFQSLSAPIYPQPDNLQELRNNYTQQIWTLLTASEWADAPYSYAGCSVDPDQDNQPECILSSEHVLAIFEIESGTLAFLFTTMEGENVSKKVHQLIGPSSQLITGLGDPSLWKLDRGALSDPSVIAGAFGENDKHYQAIIEDNTLVFYSSEDKSQKTFHLLEKGISFHYESLSSTSTYSFTIPIVLNPWERFISGWTQRYRLFEEPNGWTVSLGSDLAVSLRSSSDLTNQSFTSSLPFIGRPENPNFDYPSGHYLPFPIFLFSGEAQTNLFIEITIAPDV